MSSVANAYSTYGLGERRAADEEVRALLQALPRERLARHQELAQGVLDYGNQLAAQGSAFAAQQQYLNALQGFAGMGGSLTPAEQWIIWRESRGRVTADNPHSSAFGIGQLTRANRERYARVLGVHPDTTDYAAQLAMMRMYIRDRYGTAENAMRFWQEHGWY